MADNDLDAYWESRKDAMYLFAAKVICNKYAGSARTIIDVGSNKTPTIEWHRNGATKLVSLDLHHPYEATGVESLKADFLAYCCEEKYDLVTCYQTLEHIDDATAFARKLLEIGSMVIASVPYKWREGFCKWHVHDPVNEEKMRVWFGKDPIFSYVATELDGIQRLICVYK